MDKITKKYVNKVSDRYKNKYKYMNKILLYTKKQKILKEKWK